MALKSLNLFRWKKSAPWKMIHVQRSRINMWNSATLDSDNSGREFESYRLVKLDLIWLTSIEMSDQSTRDP